MIATEILQLLSQIPDFEEVPESQLQWVMDKSECLTLEKGEHLFAPGEPIDKLLIILDGSFVLKLPRNNQLQTVGTFEAPVISGMLPYSRADKARAYGTALKHSCVVSLNESYFIEMIRECHELTTALVHNMSTRIRQFTKREQQDDKLMSLGKLSAGLAHELNNPSAAVVRSSKELAKHLKYVPDKFKAVIKIDMNEEKVDRVNAILFDSVSRGIKELSMMEKSDLEDELLDWLEERDIEDSDELAENFVDFGIEVSHLESISEDTPEEHQQAVFGWVNQVLTTERLVNEIEDASQRISDLVFSVKSYTHMDQAPDKVATNIHEGINNTLTMLNHKLKGSNVEIVKNYDESIATPEILPSSVNQVWTNLLDNAIDAMEDQSEKKLTITTSQDGDFIKVKINDSGSGIPEDVKDKIFDPFFTTKPIGKGTGLGLENVQQIIRVHHNGTVDVDSKPGDTTFTVCVPIKATT